MQKDNNNAEEEISLLSQINKSATKNSLLEMEEYNGDTSLSVDEISRLVEMIKEHFRNEDVTIEAVADYAYDLVGDIPGLEDEHLAQQAIKAVMSHYQRGAL